MSAKSNIEEKIWTPAQLEKIKVLRELNEFEKNNKKQEKQARIKKRLLALSEGDKVSCATITNKIDHKGKGVILNVTEHHEKGILYDVKFGRYIYEGVPAYYIRNCPKEDLENVNVWSGDFRKYVELKGKFQDVPTYKLLKMYRSDRRMGYVDGEGFDSKELLEMKRELQTREHVPRKSDRSHNGKIERIKWSEFSKQS